MVRVTKSGATDKRHTTSKDNANKARAKLLSYIQKGKSISQEEDSEPDEEVPNEQMEDQVEEKVDEPQESESESESDVEEPEPEPEPVKPKRKKKIEAVREELAELKNMFASFTMPSPVKEPEPVDPKLYTTDPLPVSRQSRLKTERELIEQKLKDHFYLSFPN